MSYTPISQTAETRQFAAQLPKPGSLNMSHRHGAVQAVPAQVAPVKKQMPMPNGAATFGTPPAPIQLAAPALNAAINWRQAFDKAKQAWQAVQGSKWLAAAPLAIAALVFCFKAMGQDMSEASPGKAVPEQLDVIRVLPPKGEPPLTTTAKSRTTATSQDKKQSQQALDLLNRKVDVLSREAETMRMTLANQERALIKLQAHGAMPAALVQASLQPVPVMASPPPVNNKPWQTVAVGLGAVVLIIAMWVSRPPYMRPKLAGCATTPVSPTRASHVMLLPAPALAKFLPWRMGSFGLKGPVRDDMQDAFAHFALPNKAQAVVVCDGVGGEPHGAEASELVVAAVKACLLSQNRVGMQETLQAVDAAAAALANHAMVKGINYGLRTTLMLMIRTQGDVVFYACQGDGGLFHVRGTDGVVTALFQPQRDKAGYLMASLGPRTAGKPLAGAIHMHSGDLLFSGTDGIWERTPDPAALCDWLAKRMGDAGGNIQTALEAALAEFVQIQNSGRYVADDNASMGCLGTDSPPAFLSLKPCAAQSVTTKELHHA